MKKNNIYSKQIFIFVLFSLLLIGLVHADRINPARKYCEELNYEYKYNPSTGSEDCILPDGTSVVAWKFLLGEVAQEYSYCVQNDLEIEIITDSNICSDLGVETCAVCLFPDNKKIEVTKAMDLELVTGSCGDGFCNIGETYETCKSDCQSGSVDGFCDGVGDGICDDDCVAQQIPASDIDCPYCGDGICKLKESYKNCKADCPSGFKDDYCDSVSDGRCDPDCIENQDIDCNSDLSFWQKFVNWIKSLFS